MKKLLFAALLTVSLSASAFAEPSTGNYATSSFANDFKGASNVTWKITPNFVKASFVLHNVHMEAFYDTEGKILATSKVISADALPEKAKIIIAEKYGNYSMKESIRMEGAEGDEADYLSMENEMETLILKVADDATVTKLTRIKK